MRAFNSRNGAELSGRVQTAERLMERMRGLLGREGIEEDGALLIKPCMGVHTFGMKFPIDVLFLDGRHRVVKIRTDMPPNRLSEIVPAARSVLELKAGSLTASETRVGDIILFDE